MLLVKSQYSGLQSEMICPLSPTPRARGTRISLQKKDDTGLGMENAGIFLSVATMQKKNIFLYDFPL